MKRIFVLAIVILNIYICNQALAVVSVIDSANLAKSGEQVVSLTRQLTTMKEQLDQAKKQYTALTGNRSLGQIFYDPTLRNYLPVEFQNIYNMANSNYGISGSIDSIIKSEEFNGSIEDIQVKIRNREKRRIATNKAVGLKAYEGAKQRLNQIESLLNKINDTQDLKAIGELQARIAVEQAAISNELTKLQMIRGLQIAEKELIEEQKREMNRRLLDSSNTKMPRIK